MSVHTDEVKISIVVTCYNLEHFIKEALDSLLAQETVFSYEIIVVDDASTDRSKEVIAGIKDDRVHFISLDKNVGAPEAINIAWSKARGKYMCRFDGDDRWYPQYLQKAATLLDQHPEVVLVHTDVSFIDEHGRVTSPGKNINRPVALKTIDNEFESILQKYYINAPAIMARKSNWDKVLPWQERFRSGLGDWYNSLLMLEKGLSAFIDEPLAYYRIHTTNMHRSMIKNKSAEANTLWILDFFRQRDNGVSSKKWKLVYFKQNRHLGFSYFSADMEKDALRCLNRAVKYHPAALLDMEFLRIWFASIVGKQVYTKAKKIFGK